MAGVPNPNAPNALAAVYAAGQQAQPQRNRLRDLMDSFGQAARMGANSLLAPLTGEGLDQPFFPTLESGGRLGAIASLLTMPMVPGAAPAGALGVYGGRLAKTANLDKLAEAERLAAGGAGDEAIRSATGWFRGPDQQWRFEIPDDAADIARRPSWTTVGRELDHPALFDAYPDLEDIRLTNDSLFLGEGVSGRYSAPGEFPEFIAMPAQSKSTLLHELQHAIQQREGFASGGEATDLDAYRRLAGEVEARDVQARMQMTPEERAATAPYSSQGLTFDQMIVQSRGGRADSADLPMDEASRMARARDMGYTTDAYHGTNADVRAFDPAKIGTATDEGFFGSGFYFTDNPSVASGYADGSGANVMPVRLRLQNPYRFPTRQTHGPRFREALAEEGRRLGVDFSTADEAEVTAALKRAGYDGIAATQGERTEYVAFDPEQIRSRFAAFDPAKGDSADLLASGVPAGQVVPDAAQPAPAGPPMTRAEYIRYLMAGGA